MTAALISACNEALGMVAKGSIVSLSEASLEAQECSRIATPLLAELADWTEWRFMVKREALALLTNDRPSEWLYAYAVPNDMADPLAIYDVVEDATSLPLTGPYPFPLNAAQPLRYMIEGGVIYTNVETATLAYTRNDITADDFEPLVRRAFVDELAFRLSLPFKLSGTDKQNLKQNAEVSRNRAIADAENKNQRFDVNYISEAEYAREGWLR